MRYAALLLVVGLALVGCGASETPIPSITSPQSTSVSPPSGLGHVPPSPNPTPVALPKRVEIPDINAESSLIETGINADDTIETPPVESPKQASWYNLSPRPGEVGPAIILGHVDGNGELGVFYRLHELKVGSTVKIQTHDGSWLSFEVYEVANFPKKQFPTDRVYGNTTEPELRLITCGGAFGNAQPGHYDDNVIGFARLTL